MTEPNNGRAADILQCVEILAESFRQKITPMTIRAYEVGLSDIEINTIKRAVVVAIRDCKFMPTVHELRELIGATSNKINSKDRPLLAWQAVREAIRKVGAYDSPRFEDCVIHAVIRELGGWVSICETTTDQMQWFEKRFIATYAALSVIKLPTDQTARLAGIVEIDNSRNGYRSQEVRVAEVRCLSVPSTMTTPTQLRIESAESTQAKIPAPAVATAKLSLACSTDDIDEPDAMPQVPALPTKSKEQQIAELRSMMAVRTHRAG